MVKVATIALFIVVGAALLGGGRVDGAVHGVRRLFPNGALGPIKAVSFALFSFLGIEMVAISSGEARARRARSRARRGSCSRMLAFVYVGGRRGARRRHAVAGRRRAAESVRHRLRGRRHSRGVHADERRGADRRAFWRQRQPLRRIAHVVLACAQRIRAGVARTRHGAGSPRNAVAVSATGMLLAVVAQEFAPEAAYLYIIGASLLRRHARVVGGACRACALPVAVVERRRRRGCRCDRRVARRRPWLDSSFSPLAIASTWWVPHRASPSSAAAPYLLVLTACVLRWHRA